MPKLVKKPMLRRHQPCQQGRVQADTRAGFRKGALERDKVVVLLGQCQRAIQTLHPATQSATARIAIQAPHFIKAETQFVIG